MEGTFSGAAGRWEKEDERGGEAVWDAEHADHAEIY